MTGLAVLLVAAAVAMAVSRWLDVPSSPFLLLGGFVLAQFGLLSIDVLQEALLLGLTFLLFVLGIELSPRRLRRAAWRRTALAVGTLQFLLVAGAGALVMLAFGHGRLTATYMGIAVAASSTVVVVRLLQRSGRLFEPFGRLVVGVLLVQDALVILGMPIVTRAPEGGGAVMFGVLTTAAMLALALLLARVFATRLAALEPDEELLLVVTVAVPFLFLLMASRLGLPIAAGAFAGGIALSSFPASGVVRAQLASVGDFFTPVLFLALGGIVATPSPTILLEALALAALVVLLTPPLVAFLAERAGLEARPALESGLMLAQTSELSLVVGLHALLLGQIGQEVFTVIALVTILTMVLTPYLTSKRVVEGLLRLHPVRRQRETAEGLSGHVLLLGCGAGGMPLLETLVMTGAQVVVVDDDPEVVSRVRHAEVICIRGDASDPDVLERAGADRAAIISSTIRRPRDNARVLERLRGKRIVVRVFEDEDARWVEEQGGIPVLYSDAAAEDFAAWFARTPTP